MDPFAVFDHMERKANDIRKELEDGYIYGVPLKRYPLNDFFLVAAYHLGVQQAAKIENQMYTATTLTFDKKEG
jgi:hypothetical protein